MRKIELSEHDVASCLRNLDASKASGPDGIPARLLKECSSQIAPKLCCLFNLSLNSGRIPSEWKSADVTPIHKRESKESVENYRPISLLPIISKALERCVYQRFYEHVAHLVSERQHGFLRNRSCVTQLLSVLHTIGYDLDRNTQTDVLYLDFAKAFDSVDHAILLQKLRSYGVTGPPLCWFEDYLTGRTQRVVVDGVASTWSPVTSGVPQGSILGPLLFVIFINDLPDFTVKGTETALYADDTKLHDTITSTNDCERLQQSLTNLDHWSVQNNIRFNPSKCKVLTISRKKSPITYDYTLGTVKLIRVCNEKDLGVITSCELAWDLHINSIISKANKMLGVLKRTSTHLTDIKTRRTLYLSLVKSQLCYATEVWSPVNNIQLSKRVESVQRRATRWILMSRGELCYKERLLALNLLPLTFDREIKDLVFLYKGLFGYLNVNISKYVTFVSHGRTRLSNTSKYILQGQICKTTTFQSSYYNRIVKIWNIVCKDICFDTVSSPSSFKRLLKRKYSSIVNSVYDAEMACTWSLFRDCSCHKT